jgi:Tfp pilus assembly protein PilN
MINLLPASEKQKILSEKRWKMILISGMIFAVFLVTFVLVLVLVNISVWTKFNSQNVLLQNRRKEAGMSEMQDLKKTILAANSNLAFLDDFYSKRTDMSGFLEEISGILPEDVSLDGVYINQFGKEKEAFQVSFSGKAPSLDGIMALRDRLKGEERFSEIDFPSDIWFQKKDFRFSVTFKAAVK